jgi:precorrin-6B methylase 2
MISTTKSRTSKVLFFFLNDIGDKFDALALKRLVDYLFVFSEKILIHFPSLIQFYIMYYDDIIDHEIRIANISNQSRILHVGCGSIPASSILLAQKTDGFVLGIDKDQHAVDHARRCVAEMGLSKQVDIKRNEALGDDLSLFDVILISQGIVPKEPVLQAISTRISNGQVIILRSFSTGESLDEQDKFLSEYYTIHDVFHHTIHGSTISIFLKRKNT